MNWLCPNKIRLAAIIVGLAIISPISAAAQPFEFVRIGDKDGFGFASTAGLVRATAAPHNLPADTDGDGVLSKDEFLPDLNRDGGVAWTSLDNFDNRSPAESANTAYQCVGCKTIGDATAGAIWTDLSLSISAPDASWPDEDGPVLPNNAEFRFEFTVDGKDIVPGSQIFFNLVFGDYDVDPALIAVGFANQPHRTLLLRNQGRRDGLIQARSTVLEFDEVFTQNDSGGWDGFMRVVFVAPRDPYTAFDFVELSLFDVVTASAAPIIKEKQL
ncbi:MAG: hypothetical protein ACTSWM_03200, partial [Alphaproteobacteria bacterium]